MTEPTPPTSNQNKRFFSSLFGVVTFVSAYLLFQVQPLTSKSILPWFGGTPSVWTTCLLFFQVLLFGGYLYAHWLSRLTASKQLLIHTALMLIAILTPIVPSDTWKPGGAEEPTLRIILTLAVNAGLPFFVLSSTGPLLQSWFRRALPGQSPWHLYSLSNVGSLLGLLLYPFLIEVHFDVPQQGRIWRVGFAVFAVCCFVAAFGTSRSSAASTDEAASSPKPTRFRQLLWFLLAALPSVMLMATTNQACLDVASLPFLWILPLTLYLLTFILAFAGDRWYWRRTCGFLLPVSLVLLTALMIVDADSGITVQLFGYFAALFFVAMCCHGELVRIKPDPSRLTEFYLWMSAGGATGGLFVGVLSPLIFDLYLELHIAVVATLLLMAVCWFPQVDSLRSRTPTALFAVLAMLLVPILWHEVQQERLSTTYVSRNFYGVLRVRERLPESDWRRRNLLNGRILHGDQYLAEEKRRWPTTYYGFETGIGRVLRTESPEPRHIAVVGLGTGTVAAYGNANDQISYYEINDDVLTISGAGADAISSDGSSVRFDPIRPPVFSYINDFPGTTRVILGDARLSLEQSESQQFDALVLDAFSSDAIPAHLLTKEAVNVYLRHMKPNGILIVHISNRHFDLRPVVAALVDEYQLVTRHIVDKPDKRDDAEREQEGFAGATESNWVLLATSEDAFHSGLADAPSLNAERRVLWTDSYSNLFDVMRGNSMSSIKDDFGALLRSLRVAIMGR